MPKNVIGSTLSTSYHGSTDHKLFNTDGSFYLRHPVETIVWSSGGLDVSTATPYGICNITVATGDPSTSPQTLTLAAPVIGCEKTIVLNTSAAYVNTIDIDLGANVRIGATSDARFINFSTLAEDYQSITLIGLTTASWAVRGVNSTVGQFNAANGIRSSTAARTS